MGVDHADRLGLVLSTHRGSRSNVVAGLILTCLTAIGGALLLWVMARGIWEANGNLPWNAKVGWSWFAVFLTVAVSGLIFAIAAFFWWLTLTTVTRVTTVHENGLAVMDSENDPTVILWVHLICVVEVDVQEPIPVLHFPANLLLPRWRSKRYELWSSERTTPVCFDKGAISDLSTFATALKGVCAKFELPLLERVERHG